jgi:hypothetical protein
VAPTTLVAKFDDDTAFIEPHALTAIFAELLDDASRCIVVGGNVVNHVGLNPVHSLLGALNVSRSAAASPASVKRHTMRYDGYQRDVMGSFQDPVEWRQGHLDVLRAIRDGRLDRFYFPPTAGQVPRPSSCAAPQEVHAGAVFDFQCDGMWRRWGINFIAFPPLGHGHFAAMRDLGHLVKNKDEVYFTMEMGRRVASAKNHSCAVADAIAVHFLNTGQASNLRKVLGVSGNGEGKDPRARDASLLAPRLVGLYREIAEHYGGVKRCCRSSGCGVFDEAWDADPNSIVKLP